MRITIEKRIDTEEVLEFASRFDEASFFHTPFWMRALCGAFKGFEPSWILAREVHDLAGIMPAVRIKRGLCHSLMALPFGTYGTPLAVDQTVRSELIRAFMDKASSFRCYRAAASLYGMDRAGTGLPESLIRSEECRVIRLEGSFDDYRSKGMSKKRRQICNGCEREGIEARHLESAEEADEFYRIYREGSRGWGGIHPYPRDLFARLFEERGQGVVMWGAFRDGAMLGGHIDMHFGSTAQAWQAGMSPQSHDTGVATFLVYSAVREAYRKGLRIFNLGSSGGDSGMIFFKESMGGEEVRYPVIDTGKRWWKWSRMK